MPIKLNDKYLREFLTEKELTSHKMWGYGKIALQSIINRNGAGNDFLGWVNLPEDYDKEEFARIKKAAAKIIENSKAVIVVGIGGSYLGARAAIEFIKSPLYNNLKKDTPDIYFLGNSISSDNLNEVISICEDKDFSVIVISKSGTTTEPAITFRILRGILEKRYGENSKDRIFVITDKNGQKSKLKALAEVKNYETFVVPDDVGGRYSVLTAVGLLPIAVSGADIDKIMSGAAEARKKYLDFP